MIIPTPRANRAPLSLTIPETSIPAGVSLVTIAITRFAWTRCRHCRDAHNRILVRPRCDVAWDSHAAQFQQKLDAQAAMMDQMAKLGATINDRTKSASARIAPPEMQAHLKGLSQLAPSLQAMQKQILDLAKLGTARREIIYDDRGDPVGVEIEGMTVQ